MTLRGEWVVLAERVVVDQGTNALTLVAMLDEIRAFQFPSLHPRFAFASLFSREDGAPEVEERFEFRLVRVDGAGGETIVHVIPVVWAPRVERMRIYTNFEFLRMLRPETLRFRVDWRRVDEDWRRGPDAPLAIKEIDLPFEERERLLAEFSKLTQGLKL